MCLSALFVKKDSHSISTAPQRPEDSLRLNPEDFSRHVPVDSVKRRHSNRRQMENIMFAAQLSSFRRLCKEKIDKLGLRHSLISTSTIKDIASSFDLGYVDDVDVSAVWGDGDFGLCCEERAFGGLWDLCVCSSCSSESCSEDTSASKCRECENPLNKDAVFYALGHTFCCEGCRCMFITEMIVDENGNSSGPRQLELEGSCPCLRGDDSCPHSSSAPQKLRRNGGLGFNKFVLRDLSETGFSDFGPGRRIALLLHDRHFN